MSVRLAGPGRPEPEHWPAGSHLRENPQLPFSELKLTLNGGSRATLANPRACGSSAPKPTFTPVDTPFNPDATPTPFAITGCEAPRLRADLKPPRPSNNAGGYSPLHVHPARADGDQYPRGSPHHPPAGLLRQSHRRPPLRRTPGRRGHLPRRQPDRRTHGRRRPRPRTYRLHRSGRVFLTGPYDGAPFGLSIDVSEHRRPAQPRHGRATRAHHRHVNPHTAQLTVTNGAIPTGKYGIPFRSRRSTC